MSRHYLNKALVLQGGGALGAYELGVARYLYGTRHYRPDIIAGVSIGAITAVLLARPKGGDPLQALEAFWKRVTVAAPWLFPSARPYASFWGNPHFFMPNVDVWRCLHWTSYYSTEPLRQTLAELVDERALADPRAMPRLIMTATDVAAGQITAFWSGDGGLTLDHVLASGSLPPAFPATEASGNDHGHRRRKAYWDGGLFDNTPLGEVIERMKPVDLHANREIIVVNLFPNKGAVPTNLHEVGDRKEALKYVNRTAADIKLLARFNAVATLIEKIRRDAGCRNLRRLRAFKTLERKYVVVPRIVPITRAGELEGPAWADFSPDGIDKLAAAGESAAKHAIKQAHAQAKARRLPPFVARWQLWGSGAKPAGA